MVVVIVGHLYVLPNGSAERRDAVGEPFRGGIVVAGVGGALIHRGSGSCAKGGKHHPNLAACAANRKNDNELGGCGRTVAYRSQLNAQSHRWPTSCLGLSPPVNPKPLAVNSPLIPPEANDILAALPAPERDRLVAQAEYTGLERRRLLVESEGSVTHAWFIVDGIASILSVMKDATGIETATVGRDGMIGIQVFHGVDIATEQTMMQVPGAAYRVPRDAFRTLLPELPALTAILHRYSVMLFTFAAQNSGCNRKHAVEMRCARWLLTVAGNLRRNELDLTHEFVSQMLGVRRATVTDTLADFEKRGLITTGRRLITILDVAGLERVTCECHGIIRAARARLLHGEALASPLRDVIKSRGETSVIGEPHG
ncbi:MAG TPA: Crp/Fnr family transcriptional regulator [Gemmatimonadaceae bacterium]|nr:Crp/Fnr family transcriptional regulator [Gemmatimonadaceae bacterium]